MKSNLRSGQPSTRVQVRCVHLFLSFISFFVFLVDNNRYRVWLDNVERVRLLNERAQTANSGVEGVFAVNQFADRQFDEFLSTIRTLPPHDDGMFVVCLSVYLLCVQR